MARANIVPAFLGCVLFIWDGQLVLRFLFACLNDNIEYQIWEDYLLHLVEKYLYPYERSKGGSINIWRCL
jgi:hypothetical protein